MKTNELIKLLQEADPNNECDVCVGNRPIYCIDRLPYYYDGRAEFVECKDDVPIKCGWRGDCDKIKIIPYDLEDVICDYPDIEIDYSGVSYNGEIQQRYIDFVKEAKEEAEKFQKWKSEYENAVVEDLPRPDFPETGSNTWRSKIINYFDKLFKK